MNDRALERLSEDLARSLDRLAEAIQRFEFTFELFWKALAAALFEVEGEPQRGPRPTLTTAVARGWLEDQRAWLNMLQARNETTHTYNEAKAREVYDRIKTFIPVLRAGRDAIVAKLEADAAGRLEKNG
jgi:nucleotidyltransferase substrate binding protein (TIGR01987 family)